ncbi:myosin head motor domain containing protein [Nitzschia inconspicua]|uniref:Myosin head motor domain containing protein n=1 Tax=Nitzschia inconspicua TaxID=303405 RepID=A0A9K3Q3E4_9STRA|nr:myosin head motor domain containing protein [Nitzschia inconspicua]
MEVNQKVWLRRESSHWGWVPAVIVRKEDVKNDGVELFNLTLVNDRTPEGIGGTPNDKIQHYFAEEEDFSVVIQVDPESLKSADHDDIKLRNLPSSFQSAGEDPEAGVLASPSTLIHNSIIGGVDDLIELTHLHEPAILHALRLRYDADIIYTSTGPILIAVNPFKPMKELYRPETMENYRLQGENSLNPSMDGGELSPSKFTTPFGKNKKRFSASSMAENAGKKRLPPHVYQTADDAYRQMLRGLENLALTNKPRKQFNRGESRIADLEGHGTPTNQSILVSGESGAGKTVTTKIVLNYFAMLSKKLSEEESNSSRNNAPANAEDNVSIEQQVLQSNPILEAFGNARTIRNDNSSRFGKYIDITFTKKGKLVGASIETYLLEKVRLIHPGPGERNYHVFYQFLKAATARERQDFFLSNKTCRDFRLLSDTGTYDRRDGVRDEEMHLDMLDAMITIGFTPETIHSLMRLVSAILFAGNMSFTPSEDGESCKLDKTKSALACSALLGITFDGLATALTKRSIIAAGETVQKLLTIEESGKACEALIKAVYGAAFDFVVEKVNASIQGSSQPSNGNDTLGASIGVLDIFGFETFEYNSFEQLCINYTNEALQQQFNRYVFKLEQQEYEKEGIMWKFISFPDNQDVLDLIDMKHTGIMALLDEQCILPKSTDNKFTRYLYARCDRHPRFSATSAQRVDYVFSIEHYAGLVEYTTEGWLEKNKDQLPSAASELIKSSDFELLLDINRFIRAEDRAGRGTVATKSVSFQFSAQLRTLRSRIETTIPHYIRCLKPNDELAPDYFEPKNIVEQLRCGGVLEAVRVSRAGYPTRYPHDIFTARYYILGDRRDNSPMSPLFSPGARDVDKDAELKKLIAKMAFDLWKLDHELMQAQLELERKRRESHANYAIVETTPHPSAIGKLHLGNKKPQNNGKSLVVESSMMTPEFQRKQPVTAKQKRKDRENHRVVRPETKEDFLALDFPSRCAVAGLQLGRTKVFLRREAFDRIEGMRSEKFFNAAASIQKMVRGRMMRNWYLDMKYAAIIVQCFIRMKISSRRVNDARVFRAAVTIQCAWRLFVSRMYVFELQLARRTAAMIIQRFWRYQKNVPQQEPPPPTPPPVAIRSPSPIKQATPHSLRKPEPIVAPLPSPARPPPPVVRERQITPVQPREIVTHDSAGLEDLFHEIQQENWAMVENILDKNPELAECPDGRSGELALHKIARHAGAWTLLIDMVLVLYPKALIHRDNMGALPIHHAAAHDNLPALEIIYSAYKEGINDTDKMGRLPIHVAANYDAVDAIKFLLAKSPEGAYTMVYRPPHNSGGGLPLHIACRNHASIGVITALLAENFASAKRADENGDLPLHLLLRCGEVVDPVVVKTLLTCFSGAVTRTDMNGDLPLAIAIKCQCSSTVTNAVLMQYPDAAGILNGDGHSPLHLAFQHNADDRTIMGLLNHAPELATQVDKKTNLLPIQVATEHEHSHFIVHTLLKRDMPIDMKEKVRAQLVPHHYSWNHIVANTEDMYHQVVTKVLQACTQPQVLALAHIEGPDGKIALAASTPVCKHEMRVMLRLFNTLEVVNQRPAYTNPVSDTQIFYALRYDPPAQSNGSFTVLHEEKNDTGDDYVEEFDDASIVSGVSKHSARTALTNRSQQSIEDKLRLIRREKGQQVIAKLTSRSEIVERELKIRKDFHLSRHYVPAIISVHHTVQHAAYSEAMAEPGYCITMEGADTTAENMMLDMRKQGKPFPEKALKRIGISLLHMHEHGIIHGDFGTHNIGKFGSRWKLLGVGGSISLGRPTDPSRGFYHPPEAIMVEQKRGAPMAKKSFSASVVSIPAHPTYDIWAYGVVLYEALAGLPLGPYACRGKRSMSSTEVSKIGMWDETQMRKALKHIPDNNLARDLLKRVLHQDPKKRVSSMRQVLEHPFFSGSSHDEDAVRHSSVANNAFYSSQSVNSHSPQGFPQTQGFPPESFDDDVFDNGFASGDGDIKWVESGESIENRHNGVSTFRNSDSSGHGRSSNESVRSGRSFGGGFRKLARNTFRGSTNNGSRQSHAAI